MRNFFYAFRYRKDTSSRSDRSEFNWFVIPTLIFFVAPFWEVLTIDSLEYFSYLLGAGLGGKYQLVFFIFFILFLRPFIALVIRRLHDLNISGIMVLALLVPYLSIFILILLATMKGSEDCNEWG